MKELGLRDRGAFWCRNNASLAQRINEGVGIARKETNDDPVGCRATNGKRPSINRAMQAAWDKCVKREYEQAQRDQAAGKPKRKK